ncbi:hypothetical protein AMS68_006346 [Peltaster fructicola]|uniref:ATP-dependent DNA helicase II subunit 1 n=1 Tax=Peltaster fructicola TaxID=286661 RepID=A0A6H0Y1T7_9PEZI|nr:hypothetical protein AMS68_006346 [Peltaster fructicola]
MADYNPRGADEDEEEDVIDEGGFKSVKDAVLFAIDISKSMLTIPSDIMERRPDTALSPALAALKCAYALMQQRIISNPSDMMGILLFGTQKSRFQEGDEDKKGNLQYPHCYLLTDLDVPAAADVKMLRDLVESDEGDQDVLQASDEEVSMANVLFCANQIFTTKAPNFASRRLFLVTDNDYPHASSRDARNAAAVRAKDLYDLGVTIELFPISHPEQGHTFDRTKFYNDIVYSATPSDPDAPAPLVADIKPAAASAQDGISLLQALLSSVASRAAPRRAIFSNLPFEIGPGLTISVKGFIILKRQEPKRTSYIYLPPDSDKPQIAIGQSTIIADDTARSVEKAEVRKAFKFGGDTISFKPEELAKIKNFGEPVLRIIGFKPQSALPSWASIKTSTFIYPSEEDYIGSTRVFSALHQKLVKDEKMGMAWYIPRRGAIPVLAAVLPSRERRSEDGDQTIPTGLWVKPLPYADDVREPPATSLVVAPDQVVDTMRNIIQQLKLPKDVYDPKKYPNPALQWFYRILQALALDEDLPDKPDDKTVPRYRQITKRAGDWILQWGEDLELAFQDWKKENGSGHIPAASGATKRLQSSGATVAKRVKEESDAGPSEAELRELYNKDNLLKSTVKDLKAFLSAKGLGRGISKKGDCVEAVTKYFETRMDTD